jgi:hypothetical protein
MLVAPARSLGAAPAHPMVPASAQTSLSSKPAWVRAAITSASTRPARPCSCIPRHHLGAPLLRSAFSDLRVSRDGIMTASFGWIACGAMFLWYVASMLHSMRRRIHLESYATLLLLSEEFYETHRRKFREWIATAARGPRRDGDRPVPRAVAPARAARPRRPLTAGVVQSTQAAPQRPARVFRVHRGPDGGSSPAGWIIATPAAPGGRS